MKEQIRVAREILAEVTPLKGDCGRACGQRCCRSLEGEETGMLLFPGEEVEPGWTVRESALGPVVICPGECERSRRPLSCRLFPLLPLPPRGEGERVRVAVDLRGRAACPIARQGLSAVQPAFREAVREAGTVLMTDAETAAFLRRLEEDREEWKRLTREWRG